MPQPIAPFAAAMQRSWQEKSTGNPLPVTYSSPALSIDDLLARLRRLGPVHGSNYAAGLLELLDLDPSLKKRMSLHDLSMLEGWAADIRRATYSVDVAPMALAMQESWAQNYAFVESEHPREPKGTGDIAGQFAAVMHDSHKQATKEKTSGDTSVSPDKPNHAERFKELGSRAGQGKATFEEIDAFIDEVSDLPKKDVSALLAEVGITDTSGSKVAQLDRLKRRITERQISAERNAEIDKHGQPSDAGKKVLELYSNFASKNTTREAIESAFTELEASNLSVSKLSEIARELGINRKLSKPELLKEMKRSVTDRLGAFHRVNYDASTNYALQMYQSWEQSAAPLSLTPAGPVITDHEVPEARKWLTTLIREIVAGLGDVRTPEINVQPPPVVDNSGPKLDAILKALQQSKETKILYDDDGKIIGKIERPIE